MGLPEGPDARGGHALRGALLLGTLLAFGCGEGLAGAPGISSEWHGSQGGHSSVQGMACEPTSEEAWALELVDEVPGGFGGFFVDAGTPTAFLVDVTQASGAALPLARATGFAPERFRFLQGQADFRTLVELRCALLATDALVGVRWTSLAVDARRNRVVLGVADAQARVKAGEGLARQGLDATLVVVVTGG